MRDEKFPDSLNWQRGMRREITWLLLAKLAGLFALWALFFSASHRIDPTEERTAEKFAITSVSGEADHD